MEKNTKYLDLKCYNDISTSRVVHLADTASLILDAYDNLSYPLIGLQVVKYLFLSKADKQ